MRRKRRRRRRIKKSPKGKQKDKRLKTPERRIVVDPSRDAEENFFFRQKNDKYVENSDIQTAQRTSKNSRTDRQLESPRLHRAYRE